MTYTTACRFRPPADDVGDAVSNGRFKKRMRLAEVPRSAVLETMLSMIGKGDSSIQVQHKLARSLSVEGFESEAMRMCAALPKEPGAIRVRLNQLTPLYFASPSCTGNFPVV